MFSKSLFGQGIDPACDYCTHASHTEDGLLHCEKRGEVQPFDHCASFSYDPLQRVPRRRPQLPTFSPEDFQL